VLYPYTKPISLLTPDLFFSVLLVIVITAAVLWKRKPLREPLFAWGFFLIFVIPSFANITKGHNELLDVYVGSDRYAYLPSVGLLFLLGLLFSQIIIERKRESIAALGCITLLFSILSFRQSMTWKNTETMFTHTAKYYPNSYVALTNLGTIRVQQGDIDEGLQYYEKSLRIRDDATTHYNVGLILSQQGKEEEAIAAFRKSVTSSPLETDAWIQLGALLAIRGETEEAIKALNEAKALDPTNEDVLLMLNELGS
jgi:tetratricopeptide (TPR) repeat protein